MIVLKAILITIGIVIALIILTVLVAFLMELVKAFSQMGRNSDKGDEK